MRWSRSLIVSGALLGAPLAGAAGREPQPHPVESVDLQRYAGRWFEIARIANEFQDKPGKQGFGACHSTVAEYEARPDGKLDVKNSCLRTNTAGESKEEIARAVGTVADDSHGAKLKVNFTGWALLRWLGIGDGDYWVLGLGPVDDQGRYAWALVGSPELEYGWVLAREPHLETPVMEQIWALAEANGYKRGDFSSH
jgi:apolipoprotein D and lipocalin family protein